MARWITMLLSLGAVMLVSALVLALFSDASVANILGFCVFMAGIVLVGFLSARFPRIDRTVKTIFAVYFRFCGWLLVSLAPVTAFSWLSKLIFRGMSPWFQIVILVIWGVLLGVVLLFVSTGHYRAVLFQKLQRVGGLAPFVYCFNALAISLMFFGSATYLLAQNGWLKFSIPAGHEHLSGKLLDLFLWHFLDAIPLLDVNKTLRWSAPLDYDSGGVGWILLLFKIVVIVPIIAAFSGYWKYRQR